MKTCSKCKSEKSLSLFHKRNDSGDGFAYACKTCVLAKRQETRAANPSWFRDWYEKNKEQVCARRRAYAAQPDVKPKRAAAKKAWAQKNAAKLTARENHRRAVAVMATPEWADKDDILCVYEEGRHFGMHVDHIVPLQSKIVCGLHVWDNLQILPAKANLSKGNRVWPDMP